MARQDNQDLYQALQNPRPARPQPGDAPGPAPPTREASLLGPSLAVGGVTTAPRGNPQVLALIASIVIAVLLLALAWVWGYYAGRASVAQGPAIDTPRESPADSTGGGTDGGGKPKPKPKPAVGEPKINTFHSLCVITYGGDRKGHAQAEALRNKLVERNFEAFVVKLGDNYSVAVGKVEDPNSADARRLRERFSKMDFEGQTRPFRQAYYVKVQLREE